MLLVSHHLGEVLGIADRITVLRDGRVAASLPCAGVDQRRLTELIVGHSALAPDTGARQPAARVDADEHAVLRVRRLAGGRVRELDFAVRAGEIVGVAGITGSGRESLAPLLTGGLPHCGEIEAARSVLAPGRPRGVVAAGVAAVPGERARLGVFPNLGVRANMTISQPERHRRWGRIVRGAERDEVEMWIGRLGIVTQGPDAPMPTLSGGNQQKVLVARALRTRPKVLVLDDPTQGIDVGARAQIHEVIERCAADGIAILLVSTDSDELARLSDRVLILAGGRLARTLERGPGLTAKSIDASQLDLTAGPAFAAAAARSEGTEGEA